MTTTIFYSSPAALATPRKPAGLRENPQPLVAAWGARFTTTGPSLILGGLLATAVSSALWAAILWSAWTAVN